LGYTKTSLASDIPQLLTRIIFAYFSIDNTDESKGPFIFFAFLSFSIVECVRYPYYLFKTIGMDESPIGKFFGHLRYNVFIVFYPLGASCDLLVGVYSAYNIKKLGLYSLMMPNSYNFSFDYSWWVTYIVPLGYILGFPINY
jgi:hypothetical protein